MYLKILISGHFVQWQITLDLENLLFANKKNCQFLLRNWIIPEGVNVQFILFIRAI